MEAVHDDRDPARSTGFIDLPGKPGIATGRQQRARPGYADLYALYPDRVINADAERRRLLRADRLVMQFPLQWYSTPSLLKEWEDAVLTPLFYTQPDVAKTTADLPILAATTTGGPRASYDPGGTAMTIDALFAPLQATARKCAWYWQLPFAVHDTRNQDDAALDREAKRYRAVLEAKPSLDRARSSPPRC